MLEPVVTDLGELRTSEKSKEAENLAFRRFLSSHHFRTEQFQILATEIQHHFDCTTCANCCRDVAVPVSQAEIDRIAAHLRQDPEYVLRTYTEPDPDRTRARVLKTKKHDCVFLEGNRCTIYEARPEVCRDFPHVSLGNHSLGGRLSSLCRWASKCPIIDDALEHYKHIVGFNHRVHVPRPG